MTTLTTRATARRLGIPTQTLREWSASGVGPLPTLRGRYDSAEVDAWRAEMDAQLAPPLRSSVHAPGAPIASDLYPPPHALDRYLQQVAQGGASIIAVVPDHQSADLC